MKLQPIGDKIVVKRSEADTKTKGGIVLPETESVRFSQGALIRFIPCSNTVTRSPILSSCTDST